MKKEQHTVKLVAELQKAYDYFNEHLFKDELPDCIMGLCNANKRTLGYYHRSQYLTSEGAIEVDRISLNPSYFVSRGVKNVMGTLVHEMCHLWRERMCGKPPRGGYHDRKWGTKMKEVGLYPSNTGEEGGKETGNQMTHYIIMDGPFEKSFKELQEKEGITLPYVHKTQLGFINAEDNPMIKEHPELLDVIEKENTFGSISKNRSNRVKYICPVCNSKVWGKKELYIVCGACKVTMDPDDN